MAIFWILPIISESLNGGYPMDLNALELFVVSARSGSLSEAARRTGIPLPTLSRKVRRLEDDIGMRLLERSPTGLVLTRFGTQLLAEVEPALSVLTQAEHSVRDATRVAGILRVSIPPYFKPVWSTLSRFQARFPAVRLDVFVTDRRVDLVADGIDVALRIGEGGHVSYVGRTLVQYRHRLVAAPSLLEHCELNRPSDLQNLPCACWRSARPPSWTLGDLEVPLEPILVTNDYEHLLHVAVAGQAVTEVPPFLAADPVMEGHLVEVLPQHPMPMQAIRLLVTDTRALSPLVRQFLDFAAESIAASVMSSN